jgi:hypothetical protein
MAFSGHGPRVLGVIIEEPLRQLLAFLAEHADTDPLVAVLINEDIGLVTVEDAAPISHGVKQHTSLICDVYGCLRC